MALYGYPLWPSDADPLRIELACIKEGGSWTYKGRKCGHGLPFHVKKAMKLLWPDMEWHRWADVIVDEFLARPKRTACWGPASSGKSFVFSRAALVMFYARPQGTTVLISSTTRDALQRRIWDYVVSSDKAARDLHRDPRSRKSWLPGSLIESKMMLLADAKDEDNRSFKDGIVAVACKVGNTFRGMSEYIGTKNEVVILVCDEAQFMPPGFLDSLANLESNERCYAAIMGNLPDVYNPLGMAAEPKIGWDALPDTDKTRVYATKWAGGTAIQLVGMDSPNLDFPEGAEPFKKLIGRRYIEQCRQNYGEESDKFNMFAAGKLPRGNMARTVFTKSQCVKFHAMEKVVWGHQPVVRGYCLDAAYSGVGGDRTPGAPFVFGKDVTNKWRFWLGPITIYRGSDSAELSHSEAIAMQCMDECVAHGIGPEHVFYDGTGRSELTSAFARLWSAKVNAIEFGGVASEREAFTGEKWLEGEKAGDVKLCHEVFDRFVTELWFAIRHCILADQMRGLTEELIDESCQRKWEMVRGARYKIEPKDGEKDGKPVGMKARGLRSPDLGDCLAVGLEGARRLGFPLGKHETPQAKRKTTLWLDYKREAEWKASSEEVLVT